MGEIIRFDENNYLVVEQYWDRAISKNRNHVAYRLIAFVDGKQKIINITALKSGNPAGIHYGSKYTIWLVNRIHQEYQSEAALIDLRNGEISKRLSINYCSREPLYDISPDGRSLAYVAYFSNEDIRHQAIYIDRMMCYPELRTTAVTKNVGVSYDAKIPGIFDFPPLWKNNDSIEFIVEEAGSDIVYERGHFGQFYVCQFTGLKALCSDNPNLKDPSALKLNRQEISTSDFLTSLPRQIIRLYGTQAYNDSWIQDRITAVTDSDTSLTFEY